MKIIYSHPRVGGDPRQATGKDLSLLPAVDAGLRRHDVAIIFLVFLFLLPIPAQAKVWTIDYQSSALTFTGTQTGQPFTGAFSGYVARVTFDPEDPAKSQIEVQIDMSTAKTGDAQRDAALPQKDWFDSTAVSYAEFSSTSVRKLSDSAFEMKGSLKIKHATRNVVIPFTMEKEKNGWRVKGNLTINRVDYGVGTGEWLADQMVGHPVVIGIDLMAY